MRSAAGGAGAARRVLRRLHERMDRRRWRRDDPLYRQVLAARLQPAVSLKVHLRPPATSSRGVHLEYTPTHGRLRLLSLATIAVEAARDHTRRRRSEP